MPATFSQQGTFQKLFSQLARFRVVDFPSNDFAAVDIHDQGKDTSADLAQRRHNN